MTEYTWLTAASQEFLERDYLDGQTVDERVDEICAAAERLLNKPGFAKAFKQVIQKGWCSLSTPIWTNFGNDRGLPISCVVGETWINTRYGGGKQASQIKVGDEVLTHRGRYRQVVDIMVTPSRCDIYEMKVVGRMTPLRLTGNHLVLTNLGWVRTDELNPNLHLVATNRVMEYSEKSHIIDLRPFCGYEFVEKDGRICKKGSSKVRLDRRKEIVSCYAMPFANVAVDDDLAWCIGLWFAEGSVATNNHQKPNGVKVTLNISERTVAERWLSLMQNKFGLKGTIYEGYAERNGKPNRWLNVVINSGVIGNFFASFGDGCKEKKMPDWMIDLSLSQSKCLLEGLMVGDGSLKDRDDVRVTLANPCLLLQVYYLGLKVGRTMSLQMQEKAGRLATTTHVYTVLFRQNKLGAAKANGKCGIPFSDGLTYAPIRSLWQTNRMETVYDFTVDEDHSFSAAGVVLHNCFGSYMLDDTEDIAYTHAEVMMMTKHGGGTSGYFGNLRGRGSKIRRNGESSGSVHFMQLFDLLINVVSQGRTRRGNFAAYQDIDHKDIMEFLALRSEGNPIQDLSFGVVVPDLWMQEMIAGDVEKRRVWAKVLECRANNGFPYIMFGDTANNNTVDVYKDKKMRISHSNLCVTGDQFAVTSTGIRRVQDLYDTQENLTLFDGEKIVRASPMRLVERNTPVFEIVTEAGRVHKVTGYHKVKTDKGMVETSSLVPGDKICVQRNKGLFGNTHEPENAFLLGLYQGDGTQTDEVIFIDLWENDFDLMEEIENSVWSIYERNEWMRYEVEVPGRGRHSRMTTIPKFSNQSPSEGGVAKVRLQSAKLKQEGFDKGIIPLWIWTSDEITQWQYIRGLLFTDGSVTLGSSKGEPVQVVLPSTNLEWLREIQILMSNLGLKPSIHPLHEAGVKLLPDGNGGRREYECAACYRLILSNKPDALAVEKATGFLSRKGVFLEDRVYRDNTKKYDMVASVRLVGHEDVYCTMVDSADHVWVCNGFVTSNCSEIMLPDSHDESFVCDLSSMNIFRYDEWKNTNAVELLAYFLDAVMTEFIQKASKIGFMERAVRFAQRHRALGIGWIGWHSYLQSKMIAFESLEAKQINVEVAKNIRDRAYAASAKMAEEYGEPEVLKGYGRRNTTLIAIAPTKSSAFILGQVSEGIEPHRANVIVKDLQKGKWTVKNPHLEQLLEEKGKNTDEVWLDILKQGGSVQHLKFLSEHEKNVFKTFMEISPKEIVVQAASRQKYIDQSQSLNLMIHPATPIKDVNALIIEAWRLGVKSLYYQISINAAQAFSRNIMSCVNCES